jgi:hypothetical protein
MTVKLFSTEIDETSVELTYADSLPLDGASKLVIVRMPLVPQEKDSLANHRLAALQQARDAIGAEIQRLTKIVNQIG